MEELRVAAARLVDYYMADEDERGDLDWQVMDDLVANLETAVALTRVTP